MKSKLLRAVGFACLRISASVFFGYVALGCIVFPRWWKDFILKGGVLKPFVWRDAIRYLLGEFKHFSPLAAILTSGLLCAFGYVIFWLGKHSSESETAKVIFFKKLPPSRITVTMLAVCSLITLTAAMLQSGSYIDEKGSAFELKTLTDRLAAIGENTDSPFAPPRTGVFLYLNEKLVIRQFETLQNDLEVKQKTESSTDELSAGIDGAGISAGVRNSKDKTVTQETPSPSPSFVTARLIRRFISDTNALKWSTYTLLGGSSDFAVRAIEAKGVQLTKEQKAKLREADKAGYERNIQNFIPFRVLLYDGTVKIRKSDGHLYLEFAEDGPIKVSVRGILAKEYLTDSMLFAFEGKEESRELMCRILAVIDSKAKDAEGNIQFAITPYAIW